MTYEEVKRIFRTKFLGTCCIDFENGDGTNECECPNSDCDNCRVAEAERMILEALEKQIPKKPRGIKDFADTDISYYLCPACGQVVYELFDFYCSSCGQKLTDWSEVEQ